MDVFGLLVAGGILLLALVWGYPRIRGFASAEFSAFTTGRPDNYLIIQTSFFHLGQDVMFYLSGGRGLTVSVDEAGRFAEDEANRFISVHASAIMISEEDVLAVSHRAVSLSKLRDPILRAATPAGVSAADSAPSTSAEQC